MKQRATSNLSAVAASYVEPSATRIMRKWGETYGLFNHDLKIPYFVQRLSEPAYFFNGGFYTTTFYVGDTGVLLLDVRDAQGKNLPAAIVRINKLLSPPSYIHTTMLISSLPPR